MIRKKHKHYKFLCLIFILIFTLSPLTESINVSGSGNIASAEVDVTAPVVSITSPTSMETLLAGETVAINANASDAVGVTKVEFYVDNVKVGESVYAPYTYNWQAVVGTHYLKAKAYDAAGNVGENTLGVAVGAKVTITNPAAGSTVGGVVNTFNATFSAPVDDASLYIDGVYRASLYVNGTNAAISYSWDTNQYANGTSHVIEVRTVSTTGRYATSGQITVTVDNSLDVTAPVVSITSPTSSNTLLAGEPVAINANASDAVGVTKVEFYVDNVKVGESVYAPYTYNWQAVVGTHYLKAKAYDAAGNVGENTVGVAVGAKVAITNPAAGSTVGGVVNTFNATFSAPVDDASLYIDGVYRASLYVNGTNAAISYSWDTNQYANGTSHVIEVRTVSTTGRYTTSGQITVTVDNVPQDTTPPNISASPIGGIYNTPVDVTLSADENANIYYTIDGTEPTTASTIYSTPINISTNKTLKFFGQDSTGNVTPVKTENYVIDTDGPAATITSPSNGSSVKGIQDVQVNVTDSQGISKIDLYIDNAFTASGSTSPLIYSWDTGTYSEGLHAVSAVVYDTVYNSSTVISNVYVDRTAPVISNVIITTTTTKATITWTTNEPADSQVEWGRYPGLGNLTPLDSNLVTNHTVVVTGLQPGAYYNFRIKSSDSVSNMATYDRTLVGTPGLYAPFIRDWLLNGPHENTQTSVLETDYLNGEGQVLPSERQVQGGKPWAKLISTTDSINVSNIYYTGQYAAYGHTYVNSPVDQDVLFWIGGQSGYKVWLNGTVVVDRDKTAQEGYTYQAVNVHLNAGWNKLLVKVSNLGGVSNFDARFSLENGSVVPGLTYQLDDPAAGVPPVDTIAPSISNPSASATSATATISWQTLDETSDTKVLYGLTDTYGSTAYLADRVINHSIQFNVEADRTYHYQIVSTDAYGNVAVSPDYVFTTTVGTASYLKSYLLNGSYANPDPNTRLSKDYLGGESLAEPSEGEGTASAGVNWTSFNSAEDYIDLSTKFGTSPDTVVYANLYVTNEYPEDLSNHQLWLGSTGGIKVWINGTPIFTNDVSRPHKFGEDRVNIVLRRGLNRILIKVTPGNNGQFGFSARVAKTDGTRSIFVGDYSEKYVVVADPSVAQMSNGEWVQVLYAEKRNTTNGKGLYIRKSYNQNKSWYPSELAVSGATTPSIIRTGNNTVLAYKKLESNIDQVYVQVYADNSSGWSIPIALTSGTSSVYSVQAYTNKENNLTYVFYSYNDGSLWFRTSTDLINWNPAVRVGRDVGIFKDGTKPLFSVIKQEDEPWKMIWYEPSSFEEFPNVANNYAYPVIKIARSDNLQSWSQPKEITLPWSEMTLLHATDLSLLEDESETLFMAYTADYYTLQHHTYGYFKYSTDGGDTWSNRYLISTALSGDQLEKFNPSLATDSSGQMYAFFAAQNKITGVPIPFRYTGPLTPKNVLGFKPGEEGDGINAATGNYTYSNVDLNIPGRGIPIIIDRTYNSLENATPGPFGYGWTFNYNVRLTTDINGNVTIISSDGRYDQYTKQINGDDVNYLPYPGVSGKLVKNTNGSWKLTQMDRSILNFDAQGKLVSMIDANNNVTSMSYDAQGRLSRVNDAAGRAIVFSYNASGYIETITTDIPNTDQWTVRYSYTGDDLTGFTESDGHSWTYNYYDGNHRIKEIVDPRGNYYVRLTYDAQGKVATQLDAEGRNVNLIYSAGKTDITDNATQKSKYFDDKYNLVRQEDTDGTTSFGYDLQGNMTGITDPKGNPTNYFYDPNGMLAKTVDADGNVIKNKHNINGDLVLEVDPTGTKTVNTFDANGNLLTTNSGGSLVTYNYDQYGQLISVVDAAYNQTTFTYDPNNYGYVVKTVTNAVYNLTEATYDGMGRNLTVKDGNGLNNYDYYSGSYNVKTITDGRNNTTTFEYDNNHNMTKEINPLGKERVYIYNKVNQLTSVTDEVYNTYSYGYDLFGNQTVVTDAYGNSSTKVYDDFKRILSSTDFNGNTTTYSYDASGNLKTVTDPEGGVTELFYDKLNRAYKVKDPNGNFSEITYDSMGRTKTYKNGAGNVIYYSYDAWGRVATVKDGKGKTVTYTYDILGRTKRITYPDNSYIEYEYDPAGNVISYRDQIGRVTQYGYDQYNRLTQVTDPFGNSIAPTYDAAGNRESTTLTTPDGKQFATVITYDQLNRVATQKELPGNLVTSVEYNDNGTVKSVQDPKLNKTTYTYDKLDRVKTVTNAEGDTVTFEYDNMGNRTKVIDGEGKPTTFAYDKVGRMVSVQDAVYATDPFNHETVYTYDLNGNLKLVKNGRGYVTEFGYDGANRLLTIKDPLGNLTSYAYDVAGSVYRRTDANGNSVLFSYDSMNRVNKVTFPDGKTIDYTYDSLGNLTKMVDPSGTVDYSYINGRLDTVSYAGNGIDVKYAYDSLGNLTEVNAFKAANNIYSNRFHYNDRNLVDQVTDANNNFYTFGYDDLGNITEIHYPNNTIATFDYDNANRIKTITDAVYGGASFLTYDYLYDRNGRRTRMTVNGSETSTYGYDDIGQLTQVVDSRGTTTYNYDGAGNRTQMNGPGGNVSYTYDAANRLTQVSLPELFDGVIPEINVG